MIFVQVFINFWLKKVKFITLNLFDIKYPWIVYSQVQIKWGVKLNGGSFWKHFEKQLNGG